MRPLFICMHTALQEGVQLYLEFQMGCRVTSEKMADEIFKEREDDINREREAKIS